MRKISAFALLLLGLTLASAAGLQAHPPDVGSLEVLATFDASHLETPESIAIDLDGNIYISLALIGEIRKIAPDGTQSTYTTFPIGVPLTPCGPFVNAVTGITLDPQGNLYASVVACDPAQRGIWKVAPDGTQEILANIPLEGIPNGIALRRGYLYIADSSLPWIWRVPADGGPAEKWIESPLLQQPPPIPGFAILPGTNGLQIFRQELFISNSGQGTIVAIPFEPDGSAGTPRVHATLPAPMGGDDFAFDVHGAIYCTTDPFNTLLKISPDGTTTEFLLTAADGLDGPTAATFGRTGQDRFNLYITNGAFPFFSTTHNPTLMRLHLGDPGAPPPW
jgi:sugar lactone lactonase YvrE